MDLNKLNKQELKELLKNIKTFNSMKKNLGKRGIEEFKNINSGESSYKIEYYNGIGSKEAEKIGIDAMKKYFGNTPTNIKMIEKNRLNGGIKIYENDKMIDLSFQKIEKMIN